MLAECVACCVSLLAVYYMYRKKPPKQSVELTRVVPSWSPIQILWLDSLPPVDSMQLVSDKHENSVSDKSGWSVLPDKHLSSHLSEELDDFSSPTDTHTHFVC